MNLCTTCGITANVLTCLARFGKPPKKLSFDVSTFHKGVCGYCKKKTSVTEDRDFFYPDVLLIKAVAKYLRPKKTLEEGFEKEMKKLGIKFIDV